MRDRPVAWIGKEFSCGLGAALAVGFAALATPGVALSEEQSLQFMIAGGVAVEVVDAWRHVINRRRVMTNDAIRIRSARIAAAISTARRLLGQRPPGATAPTGT